MVLYARKFNEVDREMSKVMRNIRLQYRNEVKLQILNVKTMTEIKLHIIQQSIPFNRFSFLINIPKNYPVSSLLVEPINISEEMRKHFDRNEFNRFHRMKYLIDAILEFCNLYKEKHQKGANIIFPAQNGEIKNKLTAHFEPLIAISDIFDSPRSKAKSRIKINNRYSDRIVRFSKSVKFEKYKQLFDIVSSKRYQTIKRRASYKQNTLMKSLQDFYYQDFQQRRFSRRKSKPHRHKVTFYCAEDNINCLALKSYLENTIEYVFLHKNVDIYAGNREYSNISSLLKNQYLISSVIQNPDLAITKPLINNDYMESFLKISNRETSEMLCDDNVTELGENCQVFIKIIYEDLMVKITRNQFLYRFEDVNVWPRFYWPTIEQQKIPLKYLTKSIEIQTSLTNMVETESKIFLSTQFVSDLIFSCIDEITVECNDKTNSRNWNYMESSKRRSISSNEDYKNPISQNYDVIEEDYLIIYESDMEYFKELNLSTVYSQPFQLRPVDSYHINAVKLSTSCSFHQVALTLKYHNLHEQIRKISSLLPLKKMYRICLKKIQLPSISDNNLYKEIDFTLELDSNIKNEMRIIQFLNVPTSSNTNYTFEFFIPKDMSHKYAFLIKENSKSDSSPLKTNCVTIHKVKDKSILHNYFIEKFKFLKYLNNINRKIYFAPISENFFSLFFENVFVYSKIMKMKSELKRIEKALKHDLNLSHICVHRIHFYKETFEFLNNLTKSVI